MYYLEEKTGDLVISGFDKGIASSPHKGIANIQNANISTESGEVLCSYDRVQESQVSIPSGTFTEIDSSHVSVSGGTMLSGNWVKATQTAIGLTSGSYYFVTVSGGSFNLSSTFNGSVINTLTTGTCTFQTVDMGLPVAKAYETYTDSNNATQYRYYILDKKGLVWVYDTGSFYTNWFLPSIDTTINPNSNIGGLTVLNGWLLLFIKNIARGKLTSLLGGGFSSLFSNTTFALNTPVNSKNSHYTVIDKSNTCFYCDGDIIGSIFPTSTSSANNANIWSYGVFTTAGDGANANLTISYMIGGDLPIVGQRMTFEAQTTMPTGLTKDQIYYVTGVTSTTFTVSATVGGTAIAPSSTGSGTLYFNSFNPLTINGATDYTYNATWRGNGTTFYLPSFEKSQSLAAISTTILAGCFSNNLYVCDKPTAAVTTTLPLPENNAVNMVVVNNMAYILAGNKGNIYLTNGSAVTAVTTVPDYCAGVPGTQSSYIEPYFTWGDIMYLRGRIYFSILDQTSSKAGNCGGIWSFIPTQNFFFGQDVGLSLRLENVNSYNTYSGYASVLLPSQNQLAISPQYFSGWESDITTPTYGIDNTGTTINNVAVIESDLIPTGTFLRKETLKQIEYKVSSPLLTGDIVSIKYRNNSTASWSALTGLQTESNALSGYYPVNFEKTQWLQLQCTLTPSGGIASNNSFCRLKEIRIR